MKKCQEKKLKKKWFSFLQTFFLKSILDIFLCPISKLKKKFWKLQLFPFFDSWEIIIYPPKIDISCFFYGNRIFGGTFGNSSFFSDIFTLKNISFILWKSIFHVFFMEIAFLGELLIIHHFLILIYFIIIYYLSFFILLMKKSC